MQGNMSLKKNTQHSKYTYTYDQNTHTIVTTPHTHTHTHITKQFKTTTVQDTQQMKLSQYNQVP